MKSYRDEQKRLSVLVTGVGGAAGIAFMQAVEAELHAADIDPNAAGLYLVPEDRRLLIPRGDSPDFVPALLRECALRKIDVLVPTVDAELEPLAAARSQFAEIGTMVMVSKQLALGDCIDKLRLMDRCVGVVPVPRYARYDDEFDPSDWQYPVILKPRRGSGGRGVVLVEKPADFAAIERDPELLVQEYLPGEEFSVDVLVTPGGEVLATVPRVRMKVDSGVAVTARTMHYPKLEDWAASAATQVGLTFVANVQFRHDRCGIPRLMEINPRFPGTMPLTVQAGVNMPALVLAACSGGKLPQGRMPFKEVAMVRTWQEHYLSPAAISRMVAETELGGETADAA